MTRKQPSVRPRCPTCDLNFDVEQSAAHLPFCSQRCRLIDLGRWLNEEIVLPVEADEPELEEVPQNEGGRRPIKLPPGWHDA